MGPGIVTGRWVVAGTTEEAVDRSAAVDLGTVYLLTGLVHQSDHVVVPEERSQIATGMIRRVLRLGPVRSPITVRDLGCEGQ